jgi:ABC-type multidrug transport system permease subunit
VNGIIEIFNQWWKKPFDPNGDAVNWILFLGFVLVVAFLWTRILKKIPELSE